MGSYSAADGGPSLHFCVVYKLYTHISFIWFLNLGLLAPSWWQKVCPVEFEHERMILDGYQVKYIKYK